MKELLYLIFVLLIFSFSSCNKDEEDTIDPIIGKWFYYSENGEIFEGCHTNSYLTFEDDGTYFGEYFNEDFDSEECVSDGIWNTDATWNNNNDETYTFVNSGETYTAEVQFSDNNETMEVTFTYEEENGEYYTITDVFKK